ncbi:hypothetical protein DL767_004619 [Monosporascus sp. MG133]|nr:hypothetical protein DL767_004619 [Monosporascus sp. MG133]
MAMLNGTRDSRGDVTKIGDEFIDTQYVKPGSSVGDYEKEPWKHCQDATRTYLSLRLQYRSEFLEKLEEPQQKQVNRELLRIKNARKQFSSYANKKDLMKKLHSSKKEWKEEVAKNVGNFEREVEKLQRELNERPAKVVSNLQGFKRELKKLEREVAKSQTELNERPAKVVSNLQGFKRELEKLLRQKTDVGGELSHEQKDLEEKWAKRLGCKYKRHWALLQRLKEWEAPAKGVPAQSQPAATVPETAGLKPVEEDVKPKPLYGLKANVMHFQLAKGTNTLVGYDHKHPEYKGQFPDQKIPMYKILNEPEKNPLMEECPHDEIRYFHFPTNNMAWIETAIARYYKEEPKPIDDRKLYDPDARKTEKLLALTPPLFFVQDSDKCFQLPYLHWETSSRRAKMVQVINEGIQDEEESPGLRRVVEEAAKKIFEGRTKSTPRPPKFKTLLGTYLMTLARVAEEMDYEADERLLREHVKADPPLHIRRTLDQYYFVTLDDTSQRDKDQVVYRGTRAGYTRVVMVDQLWLWILDENTIITSFPRRWGRNKPDSSGVNKTIRERLETRKEEIKSIYHLALIIIDQCSRVFFDRTKPLDQRPEVMDLFASAIGNVTEMTTIAYDGFWRALRTGNVGKKVLDLNPEGVLFREAQDIAEELKIMKTIYNEQLKVVKDFKRHLFDPLGKDKQGEIALLKELLLEMMKNQASSNGGNAPSEGEEPGVNAKKAKALEATLSEAEGTIELIESRQAEIQDLEDSALRTYQQQQTSIVEANAALQQGQSLMALTIVTIFFLPLGFFAAFFGMNNAEITDSPWMTLNEQIGYMIGLSFIIIIVSISLAFNPRARAILRRILWIPYRIPRILNGYLRNPIIRAKRHWNHVNMEQKMNNLSNLLQDMKNRRPMGNKDDQGDSPASWRGTPTRRRGRRGSQGSVV